MTKLDTSFKAAIDETNLQLPSSSRLLYADEQLLVGEGSALDSLGVLLFATSLESKLNESGLSVDLVSLLMDVQNSTVFSSIGTLKMYLEQKF